MERGGLQDLRTSVLQLQGTELCRQSEWGWREHCALQSEMASPFQPWETEQRTLLSPAQTSDLQNDDMVNVLSYDICHCYAAKKTNTIEDGTSWNLYLCRTIRELTKILKINFQNSRNNQTCAPVWVEFIPETSLNFGKNSWSCVLTCIIPCNLLPNSVVTLKINSIIIQIAMKTGNLTTIGWGKTGSELF